jgi:hypothetical protein
MQNRTSKKQGDMLCVCHEQEQLDQLGAVQSRTKLKQFVLKKRVEGDITERPAARLLKMDKRVTYRERQIPVVLLSHRVSPVALVHPVVVVSPGAAALAGLRVVSNVPGSGDALVFICS